MSSAGQSAFELSEKKRALLAKLLREAGVEAVTQSRIERRARTNSDPLSFAQLRLWFLDQLEPGSSFYNIATAVRFTGQLDVAALERSFAEVMRRHESLRTTFSVVNGEPVQVVMPSTETDLPFIDLSVSPGEDHDTEARRLATEESERPFDLATGPIIRWLVLRLSAREHVAVLTIHHIACDAWSIEILVKEIGALYDAFSQGQPSPLAELPVQYIDYARWQREWLRGEVLDKELAYWRDQLKEVVTLELPTDRPRPALQTFVGESRLFPLPAKVGVAVNALGRQMGTTAFMTVLAAFKALLARYTNQTDIAVGTPVANRSQPETEGLIGFFLNTLVMRTDFSGDPTFAELLGRVRETALGAYAHQEIPFEKLVEELQPRRDMSHSPFFQVMFVLENLAQWESDGTQILSGLTMSRFPLGRATAKFDLTVSIRESLDDWSCFIEHNTDLFDAETIDRIFTHFLTLLEAAVAQPELRLSELPLLSAAERQQLLVEWNATEVIGFEHACVHELFEKQAQRTPDACAVFFEGVRLSYAELNARANQLAHHLRRHGVGPESVVGICVSRSAEMAVSVLAMLKAGGAYLPLDPNYPRERLQFMLEDAAVQVLLTNEGLRDVLPSHRAKVICLDSDAEAFAGESNLNPRASVAPENPGYVIYTSGSTGRPKGVCMPHRVLVNLIEWDRAYMPAAAGTLQFASLSFDVSFMEMFSTWSTGGTLFIVSDELRMDIEGLAHLISEQRIERVTLPVVVLQQLAERCSARPQILSSLRTVITTGEQLRITPPVVQLFKALRGCRLHNIYGPSETHAVTALLTSDAPDTWPAQPSIGRPIFNTQIYVLDGHLKPVPLGVIGELYIGGDTLARGYLDRPALTAEKFVPDPFHTRAGSRLYRTGDLARYLPNGNIEFLGRMDHQVKIRGFRVELGEVESVLGQHSSVLEAVVLARADAGGEQQLVAYLVCEPGYESNHSEWRRYLAERLPEYMIPAHFITMQKLPLTANGKLDRRALPAPERSRPKLEAVYEPPRNATEEVVVRVWAEVLKVERIGVNDNFFDLGGHSLSATGVIFRLREALRIDLPLRALFESPTPRELADALARAWGDREVLEEIARTNLELEQLSDDEVKALIGQSLKLPRQPSQSTMPLLLDPQDQSHKSKSVAHSPIGLPSAHVIKIVGSVMNVGLVAAKDIDTQSLKYVWEGIDQSLVKRHKVYHRPREVFYSSPRKQEELNAQFLRNSDVMVGKFDEGLLRARERSDRQPPLMGLMLGAMSRGGPEFPPIYRYLKSTDVLVGNCSGDVEIAARIFKNCQARILPFVFDESTFHPVQKSQREALKTELGFQKSDRILLYAGRMTLEKNLHTLLRVFSIVQQRFPDVHLVMVGDLAYVPFREFGVFPVDIMSVINKTLTELQLNTERIHFVGAKNPAQLRDYYIIADVLVNLTLHHDENFGFAQVEAMACGTPVIGTKWGGLKDTIKHNETGYHVSTVVTDAGVKLNWWEAINRIVQLLEDEATLQKFRERCPVHVKEHFSIQRYDEILESILVDCKKRSENGSEPLILSEFGAEFWQQCQYRSLLPPPYRRGKRSMDLYKELIAPFTGVTESLVAPFYNLKADHLLVLASPVEVQAGIIKINDPIFPMEVVVPNDYQKTCNAALEILTKEPVMQFERLKSLLDVSLLAGLDATLKWMLNAGILLRTRPMNPSIDPKIVGEQMGKPLFAIQNVDYRSDIMVITKGSD